MKYRDWKISWKNNYIINYWKFSRFLNEKYLWNELQESLLIPNGIEFSRFVNERVTLLLINGLGQVFWLGLGLQWRKMLLNDNVK